MGVLSDKFLGVGNWFVGRWKIQTDVCKPERQELEKKIEERTEKNNSDLM